MDEARRKGLRVDTRRLAADLGVPAVPTAARRGEGLRDLVRTVAEVAEGNVTTAPRRLAGSNELQAAVAELLPLIEAVAPGLPNARWVAMRLLDGDHRVRQALESGELHRLAERQQAAAPRFSRKIALEGAQ
jgi:ferrous iron transport protein B